ncbi:polysaccharide deacetylase [Gemmatirosa kalamazoonensis]|uniref:Polysaccharide deacetylase n=2 Tax=Gemmatirosa kalamazoonensis TaxID=861299 RepID=W0RFA9_9BACT|nr:polysaccharide deacetylase [Gemmatirosa kalamazoonensis]
MLMYHRVSECPAGSRHPEITVAPQRFAEQLAMLRALDCTLVPLSTYLAYRRGEGALPPRAVVVTFDDGYLDNYATAFPILREFGAGATIFLVSSLLGGTNVWDPDEPQTPLMGTCHVREMQRAGIDFQSHTATHARLTALAPACALRELAESRDALAQLLGAPVRAVAYPWGAHDETVQRLAEDAGYEAATIVRRRVNFDDTPPFALRRIGVWRSTTVARLAWDILRLRWRGA